MNKLGDSGFSANSQYNELIRLGYPSHIADQIVRDRFRSIQHLNITDPKAMGMAAYNFTRANSYHSSTAGVGIIPQVIRKEDNNNDDKKKLLLI